MSVNEVSQVKAAQYLASLLLLCAVFLGCGYGLVGRTSNLPADIESIYIQPLTNRTTRQQVDLLLTEAIVNELVTRRRFEIASNKTSADAILSGDILAFTVRPISFGPDGRAIEYEIAIRADMIFQRTDNQEIIWAQNQYLFRENYDFVEEVGNTGALLFNPEDATIIEVSRKFAQTLVIDLLEGF